MRVGAAAALYCDLEKERDALRQQLQEAQHMCGELQQKHTAMKGQRDAMKAEREQMRRERDAMKAERDAMKQRLDAALLWTGACVCVSVAYCVLPLAHFPTEHPALLFILHANNGHSYPKLSFSSPFPLLTPSSITTFHVLHPSLAPPQRVCAAAEH